MCECVCVCAAVRVGDEIAKIGKHPNRRLLYPVKTQIVAHNGHPVSAMYVVGIPMKTFLILRPIVGGMLRNMFTVSAARGDNNSRPRRLFSWGVFFSLFFLMTVATTQYTYNPATYK